LDDAESARDDDGRARKRELYSALYQYAEAFEAERASRELQFRLADVDHRKMLASQRSSIDTWNNSVAFLLGQLATHHSAGVDPAVIADAIGTIFGAGEIGAGGAQ